MILLSHFFGPFETNAYFVLPEGSKEAVAIDAPLGSSPWYGDLCQKYGVRLKLLLLTHSHYDHTADAKKIQEDLGAKVAVHPLDQGNLAKPGSDGLPLYFSIDPVQEDLLVRENDRLHVGNLTIEVIETPGHTPGGVCYYLKESGILFSGDTLFKGTIGNLSFPTAVPDKMWVSLKKLAKLPQKTLVYPGHGEATTLSKENWLERAQEIFD